MTWKNLENYDVYSIPPADEPVIWQRNHGNTEPFVATWSSFDPLFNVHGLSWRRIEDSAPLTK